MEKIEIIIYISLSLCFCFNTLPCKFASVFPFEMCTPFSHNVVSTCVGFFGKHFDNVVVTGSCAVYLLLHAAQQQGTKLPRHFLKWLQEYNLRDIDLLSVPSPQFDDNNVNTLTLKAIKGNADTHFRKTLGNAWKRNAYGNLCGTYKSDSTPPVDVLFVRAVNFAMTKEGIRIQCPKELLTNYEENKDKEGDTIRNNKGDDVKISILRWLISNTKLPKTVHVELPRGNTRRRMSSSSPDVSRCLFGGVTAPSPPQKRLLPSNTLPITKKPISPLERCLF